MKKLKLKMKKLCYIAMLLFIAISCSENKVEESKVDELSSIISKLNKDNVIHISPSEDGKISFCIFEKKPKSIKINRIDILKFPELNPNRENWDVKYPGQSSDITRPDLIWDISQSTKLSTLLSRDNNIDRDDNAEQGKVYPQIFENPVTIQKGISYGFYLYDHDTTSPNDAMGTVPFQVPDGYPDSKTFKSSNDKIHIKVYFTYNYSKQ